MSCNKSSIERFGDDLTEVLLSYLSFEDRFRYECVSKHWRRLIFNGRRALSIDDFVLNCQSFPYVLELNRLETILKKCPHIRSIRVNDWVQNAEQVFHVINRCCDRRLSAIESDFDRLSHRTVAEFAAKFGQNLRQITFHTKADQNKHVLNRLPKVNSLDIKLFGNLSPIFGSTGVLHANVRQISFVYSADDWHRIGDFCAANTRTVRALEVLTIKELTADHMRHLFSQLAQLTALRSLDITCYLVADHHVFVQLLCDLAAGCPELKKLQLVLHTKSLAANLDIFKALNRFRRLRVLYLNLFGYQSATTDPTGDLQHRLSASLLANCRHLQQLTLDSYDILVGDHFFANIADHWPRLQRIFCTNVDITGRAFDSLSALRHLLYVYLWSSRTDGAAIDESAILTLVDKCPKLSSITYRNGILRVELEDRAIAALRDRHRHPNTDQQIFIYQ